MKQLFFAPMASPAFFAVDLKAAASAGMKAVCAFRPSREADQVDACLFQGPSAFASFCRTCLGR
jgi:hypothetical protein